MPVHYLPGGEGGGGDWAPEELKKGKLKAGPSRQRSGVNLLQISALLFQSIPGGKDPVLQGMREYKMKTFLMGLRMSLGRGVIT